MPECLIEGVTLIGDEGQPVGPITADDDRVDTEHPDQAVDALPRVRRGVDEGVLNSENSIRANHSPAY